MTTKWIDEVTPEDMELSGPQYWPVILAELLEDRYIQRRPELAYLVALKRVQKKRKKDGKTEQPKYLDVRITRSYLTRKRSGFKRKRITKMIRKYHHIINWQNPEEDIKLFLENLRQHLRMTMPIKPMLNCHVALFFDDSNNDYRNVVTFSAMAMNRPNVFEPFVTTVGTNGTITLPLLDEKTGGIPLLKIGPHHSRNGIRFWAKMPSVDDALHLPTPLNADPSSVTFEPVLLYTDGPLPPHSTAHFFRVYGGKEKGKMSKKPMHRWQPRADTTIYPANEIRIPHLRPEDTIEFEGVSYFYNPRVSKKNTNPFHWPLPSVPPPAVASQHAIMVMLLVRMHWLPKDSPKKRFRVVKGSPVDWSQTPTAETPQAEDPMVTPDNPMPRNED